MRRVGTVCLVFVFLSACGGGGGGNGSPGGQTTYYVRATGSDSNGGGSPDKALGTISKAINQAGPGATIVVGPGTYRERVVDPKSGTDGAPITYLADPSGALTTDSPGPVVIDTTDVADPAKSAAAFRFSGAQFIVIDGFEITGVAGGSSAGIFIRNRTKNKVPVPAHDITIRNCQITGNEGDAIRVSNSNDVLVFNNLITGNGRRGVAVVGDLTGSQRPRLINNTITGNTDRGIFIGESGAASEGAVLRNNIVQDNGGEQRRANIQVDAGSLGGFDSAFNLVFPARYNPADLPHDTDIEADAAFVDVDRGNYHLNQDLSPAIDAGASDLDEPLLDALREATTDSDGRPDVGDVDLGFHYPTDQPPEQPGPPKTVYVRADAGDDANDGLSPEQAVSSISLALARARSGDTVIVGPGLYFEGNLSPRDDIVVLADAGGTMTGDDPGEVRVDARGKNTGFRLDRSAGTIVDGFVVARASVTGIEVRNDSHDAVIRNCQVLNGFKDGVLVTDSNDVLLFNNLVANNTRWGIGIGGTVNGSSGTRVVNNTVAFNQDRGIRIGDASVASPGTFVENNIVQHNFPNIQVVGEALSDYTALYNLVFDASYAPEDLPRTNDINEDAVFVNSSDGDFHLDPDSPAIDAADPDTATPLVSRLRQRTTQSDEAPDSGPLDMGFHYP